MPPFLPRKRLASPPPNSATPRKKTKLNDVLDMNPGQSADIQAAKYFTLGEEDSDSSLSDIDTDEFGDISHHVGERSQEKNVEKNVEYDEDIDWEDAILEHASVKRKHFPEANLELNLSRNVDEVDQYDLARAATSAKKGPTKIERGIRVQTHCMHVQFLLYHNAIRNCWTCDKEVQNILVKQLPPGINKEVQKWRAASGSEHEQGIPPSKGTASMSGSKIKGKRTTTDDERNQRDWGKRSNRLENGKPDLSRGDPVIPLLKILAAYWKKRFSITAPGLRKIGYASTAVRQWQIRSFQNDKHDPKKHGEKIESLSEFRKLARKCEGSRDVGAQLFTALLRGIGIESRLVASLQPSGFGWTKNEQAESRIPGKAIGHESEDSSSDVSDELGRSASVKQSSTNSGKRKGQSHEGRQTTRCKGKGHSRDPVDLDTSSSEESALPELDEAFVIEAPSATPVRKLPQYDRDLPFPIYWTEIVSPINSVVIPVSPLVLSNPVASTSEILSAFEPRGARAEKAKQVMAYVVAYSSDGSAKDVTTRYLKRQLWPGKTRGVRIPVEKIPIYNKRGKVIRYEENDWFKSVMSEYARTEKMRTAVDDIEESTDLVPQQPEIKESKKEGDTLQSLKSSAEFVLERFLRREEALKPNAKPVRKFATGKGDKVKEENVYYRADVERCLSAESWHKEGRQIKQGEAPLKLVPIRAVTLTRKRDVEEMQRQTGEKPTQGLYSRDQTEYIIPPPIKDGVIPRNAYGNIDCFVPSMVPSGAVHIPMRGTVRICKRLEIDYAEAVTGFEFGKKLAIPVVEGVVVAKEHEEAVRGAWDEYAEQQRIKEEGKLEKAVLILWKRMLMGLRIRERVSETYGDNVETSTVTRDPADKSRKLQNILPPADVIGGLDEGLVDDMQGGGGFFLPHEDGEDLVASTDEIVVGHHETVQQKKHKEVEQYPTPLSITPTTAKKSGRSRKSAVETSDSSELSEVETLADEPDGEDNYIGVERARMGKRYMTESQRQAHIVVEIPETNQRPTKQQLLAPSSAQPMEQATLPLTSSGSDRNGYQHQKENSEPFEPAEGKRQSGKTRKLSAALATSSKRKQQTRGVSRKAALTSPYFDADGDGTAD